jgi:hypothetical protein
LYVILWSTINQTTRVILASNRRTSKNKINKNSICIHEIWGLESSRTGGLADTRVYKEVATVTYNKTKPNLFVVAMEVYERVEDNQRGDGVVLQP